MAPADGHIAGETGVVWIAGMVGSTETSSRGGADGSSIVGGCSAVDGGGGTTSGMGTSALLCSTAEEAQLEGGVKSSMCNAGSGTGRGAPRNNLSSSATTSSLARRSASSSSTVRIPCIPRETVSWWLLIHSQTRRRRSVKKRPIVLRRCSDTWIVAFTSASSSLRERLSLSYVSRRSKRSAGMWEAIVIK